MTTVISVENLSKRYRLGVVSSGYFVRDVGRWWAGVRGKPDPLARIGEADHGNREGEYVWALKDVNFDVKEGDALGIIGANGAGKSTLLKILSQITAPTEGRVKIKGRIGSLLEVGTGFHPELTGRENVYLNGTIMGMTKVEIERKFDEIVDFSGVERYIDTPVKRYSSGMRVRLGFAVAAHLDPEILVVDEVLAVGDAAFQKKCLGKMGEVAGEGRTVLFVSHNMQSVEQLCNKCILLRSGKVDGVSDNVMGLLNSYIRSSTAGSEESYWENEDQIVDNPWFLPLRFYISDENGNVASMPARNDEDIWVRLDGMIDQPHPSLIIGYHLFDDHDRLIYVSWSIDSREERWPQFESGKCSLFTKLPKRMLNEGEYRLSLSIQVRRTALSKINIIPSDNPINLSLSIKGGLSDSPIWKPRSGILAPIFEWEIINSSRE